jgi:molybdenum cofactor cytidylyltransferase
MNAVTSPRLDVIILAAGFSSRLGRPKALARVRGISLLRRTAALAARLSPSPIVVVIPHRAISFQNEVRGLDVRFAANPRRAEGLSSSVQRGIAASRYASALLILPVDLASLKYSDLSRLVARWRTARRSVIATRHGGSPRGGVPLILPRWLYARACEVRGDIGLRDLIGGLQRGQRVLLNLPSAALDVDTPRDLETVRRKRYSRAL